MTRQQQTKIEMLRKETLRAFIFRDDYEIKRWEAIENPDWGFIDLRVTTGRKNDDGTLAALLRNNFQLFIGPRGGITYIDNYGTQQKFKGVFDAYYKQYYRWKEKAQ